MVRGMDKMIISNSDYNQLETALNRGNQGFSRTIMSFLEKYQPLDEQDIAVLSSRPECRELFQSDYPIIKRIDKSKPLKEQVKDRSGHNRYYSDVYNLLGENYVMTSQLYGYSSNPTHSDNRTPFLRWIIDKVDPTVWWPNLDDYSPGLDVNKWISLLTDANLVEEVWLGALAAFYGNGGSATCSELGKKYNRSPQSISGNCTQLAKRIYAETHCPLYTEEEQNKYWPIMFQGREANSDEIGSSVWRLRPELKQALKEVNIMRYEWIGNEEETENIKEALKTINAYIRNKGFVYENGTIENLYLSIKSKPFVLLAGTSGTGKTRLVRLFSEAIGANYKMVPVRPDWSDSSDLFGYVDLNGRFVKGSIIDFVKEAQDNPDKPYILCLDEMNLARVEYYFSDFLSIVETRDYRDGSIVSDPLVSLSTYKTDMDAQAHYGELGFPENLYLIGTVNMDETTFPFSRKVLDRANTIEFNTVELMPHFEDDPVELVDNLIVNNSFLKTNYLFLVDCEDKDYVTDVCKELNSFNGALKKIDSQIGYRIRDEIVFYMLNNHVAGDLLPKEDAFDNCLMQKILPRLQGSSMALRDTLVLLFKDCLDEIADINNATDMYEYLDSGNDMVYPKSAAKIAYMTKRLEEDGFTSYWL